MQNGKDIFRTLELGVGLARSLATTLLSMVFIYSVLYPLAVEGYTAAMAVSVSGWVVED